MTKQPTLFGWLLRDLFIALILALVLWSTSTWISATDWTSAKVAGALFGFVGAYMLCYILHEWGHLAGALLTSSTMPLNDYLNVGIGRFDIASHSRTQFLALSWGGVAGYVLVLVGVTLLYLNPILPWVAGGLLVGGLAFVVQSLAVDLPQIWRVHRGDDIAATSAAGANATVILQRTWQTWTPLAVLILVWNLN